MVMSGAETGTYCAAHRNHFPRLACLKSRLSRFPSMAFQSHTKHRHLHRFRHSALSFSSTLLLPGSCLSSLHPATMSGRGKGKTAKKSVSQSSKAGLQFPVGRVAR
jgi:hypothetical protein